MSEDAALRELFRNEILLTQAPSDQPSGLE
jgi:hypothetical protein